jgi:LytS/YehU family sensor histidine kinase
MCLRLAEFLRDSLTLGSESGLRSGREAALAEQYLAVEQVRFGTRLQFATSIRSGRRPDAGAAAC